MDLILEITRQCNLKCAHCLRGDAQNINISREIVRKVFESIDYANSLVLTGGEPLMVPEVLEMIIEEIDNSGFGYGAFWLATNGCYMENFKYVIDFMLKSELPETSGIRISRDQYHGSFRSLKEPWNDPLKVQKVFPWIRYTDYINTVINTGRAKERKIGKRDVIENEETEITDVYVTAKGNIHFECDMSYEDLDKPLFTLDQLEDIWLYVTQCYEECGESYPTLGGLKRYMEKI